jgi:hypothetical protein
MMPVELYGLEFPSVARINAGTAVEGLWQDLNHHVPSCRNIARLTLADWTCSINHCVYLLDGKGLLREYSGQYRKLPAAWIVANKVMKALEPKLSLRITECSYIQHGEVSLSHILNIAKAHRISISDGRALKMLSSWGIVRLADVGSWRSVDNRVIDFKSQIELPSESKWTEKSKENWIRVTQALNHIDPKWFTIGDTDLMMMRDIRRSHAELYIKMLATIQPLPQSSLPHVGTNWASDGSMVPAASGIGDTKSVTVAITGPQTLVFRIMGHNISILQGELMGLVMGLILAAESTSSTLLYMDHLNSIRFIKDL